MNARRRAVLIAGTYLLLAIVWIFFSDKLLARYSGSLERFTLLDTYKGWAFAALTTLLFFLLIDRAFRETARLNEKLNTLIDSVEDHALIGLDLTGNIISWSRGAERIHGYNEKYILGRSSECFFTPEDCRNGRLAQLLDAARDNGRADAQGWQVRADGSQFWAELVVTPIRDLKGRISGFAEVTRDRTAEKMAQDALQESENRYRQLLEGLPHLIWVCSPEGNCTYMCREWMNYTGVSIDQQLGQGWLNQVHPADRDTVFNSWRQALASHQEFRAEFRLRHHDGQYRWFDSQALPIRDRHGRVVEWFGIDFDIQTTRELLDSLHQQAKLIEMAYDPIMVWSREQGIVFWNRGCEQLYGYTQQEAGGHQPYELLKTVFPASAQEFLTEFNPVNHWMGELRHTQKNGGNVVVTSRIQRLEVNGHNMLLEVNHDITERLIQEGQLRQSEQRFRQLVELLPLLVWTCNPDGLCDYLNPQWILFTGLPENQQLGYRWLDQIHPDDRRHVKDRWEASVNEKTPFDAEFRLRRADGEYHWFYARSIPLLDDQNQVAKWLGFNANIEERKQAEEKLKVAASLKHEFLPMLAHELRNPLVPIRNAAELIRQLSADQAKIHMAADLIERQVSLLTQLVDELLDVTRLNQGRVILKKSQLILNEVIYRAIEASQPLIESRKHQLSVELCPQPISLMADLARLVQAVSNLLNNAAKYTREGGAILIRTERDGQWAVIRIKDNGPGINPDLLPHIFDLFTQGARTLDRSQGGLGIGLTLVKHLVELHGGTVQAFSAGFSYGSEFVIHLPIDAELQQTAPVSSSDSSAASTAAPLKVLIVDDNRSVAESMSWLLELDGHKTSIAEDGPTALRISESFAPDVVLLDIGLPEMDGYEVARKFRTLPRTRPALLIALTGYGQEKDQILSKEAGIDHHLVKPANYHELSGLIAAYAAKSTHPLEW